MLKGRAFVIAVWMLVVTSTQGEIFRITSSASEIRDKKNNCPDFVVFFHSTDSSLSSFQLRATDSLINETFNECKFNDATKSGKCYMPYMSLDQESTMNFTVIGNGSVMSKPYSKQIFLREICGPFINLSVSHVGDNSTLYWQEGWGKTCLDNDFAEEILCIRYEKGKHTGDQWKSTIKDINQMGSMCAAETKDGRNKCHIKLGRLQPNKSFRFRVRYSLHGCDDGFSEWSQFASVPPRRSTPTTSQKSPRKTGGMKLFKLYIIPTIAGALLVIVVMLLIHVRRRMKRATRDNDDAQDYVTPRTHTYVSADDTIINVKYIYGREG